MHSETEQGTPRPFVPRRFTYPKKVWRFGMLCGLLFVALLGVSYGPHVTGWPLVMCVVGACVLALAVVVCLLGNLSAWLGRRRGCVLTDKGIAVEWGWTGRRSFKWEQIRRIVRSGDSVIIRISRWSGPALLAYPFVFRNIIPEILRRRPNLKVGKDIQRCLADPGRPTRLKRRGVILGLTCNTVLALLALWPEIVGLDSIDGILIAYVFILASFSVALHAAFTASAAGAKAGFLPAALLCPMIVGLALILHIFSGAPQSSLHMMVAAGATITILGFLVVLTPAALTRWRQAIILCLLVAVPAGVFACGKATAWPRQDISHLFPDDAYYFGWHRSGRHPAPLYANDLQHVVEFPSLAVRPIPQYPGGRSIIYWYGDAYLVRAVESPNVADPEQSDHNVRKLLIYDFSEGRETQIPTVGRFVCAQVSPNGRYIAWLNEIPPPDPEDPQTPAESQLCLYDLQNKECLIQPLVLPDYAQVCWQRVGWQDDTNVIVRGEQRFPRESQETKTALHLFRLELPTMQTERSASTLKFDYWSPSPDFRRAFGDNRGGALSYVDLHTGEVTELAPGYTPTWQPDSRYAYRIRDHKGKAWLARFDAEEATETLLWEAPRETDLRSISPRGRWALFEHHKLLCLRTWIVADIATGKRHTIETPGGLSYGPLWTPFLSPWSPDERTLILHSHPLHGPITWVTLHTIPADWP